MKATKLSGFQKFLLYGGFALLIGLLAIGLASVIGIYALPTSNCQGENGQNLCTLADDANTYLQYLMTLLNGLVTTTDDIAETTHNMSQTLDQFLVFGQSTCNAQLGIYNVTSYFPALRPEYDAIIRFDNIRSPTNATDPTRRNITYFPAYPIAFPNGTGLGINVPFLVGNLINHSRFEKHLGIPYSVYFAIGTNTTDLSPTDPRLSVFIKNLQDRGPLNLEHRRYKAALTRSKVVGRYSNRIKKFVSNVYDSWVINKAPMLSTFQSRLVDFFLDIHLGTADHPAVVRQYFADFLYFVTTTDTNAVSAIRVMTLHMNAQCVREYFRERMAVIIATTATDTIPWNWLQAGMPIETTVLEAIHNIIAFGQFGHTVQLLVNQALNPGVTPGTGGLTFLQLYRRAAAGLGISFALPPPYVNSSIYSGTPEQLKINVVREFFRITLPNNLWFSLDLDNNCTGCSPSTQSRHIAQLIQIRGEYDKAGLVTPWSPAGSAGWNTAAQLYGRYDPIRYAASFMGAFSTAIVGGTSTSPAFDASDLQPGIASSIASMTFSPVDNETVIPATDAAMIPVFPTPIYAPWGLGGRRCPGEIFNQFVGLELFEALQCLQFKDDCVANPSFCNPSSPNYKYLPVPLAPFKAVPDSLFVLNTNCPP